MLEILTPLLRDRRADGGGRAMAEDAAPVVASHVPERVAAAPGADAGPVILSALGPAPVSIDALVQATGMPVRQVRVALLELALAGRIEQHGGQLVSLRTPLTPDGDPTSP